MKKILSLLLFVYLLSVFPEGKANAALNCVEYSGKNENAQDYKGNYASVIKSYLTIGEDGSLMRFQYLDDNGYIAEYYDTSYQLLDIKIIDAELPLFGAFYASENNYFILTGQKNKQQSASVECYRITKYDKNWNKITSTGLYDCNTTIPFRAGSARITEKKEFLFIRTCHEIYTSEDGINHQKNVTIQLNKDTMEITNSYVKVENHPYGHVGHSFNQFIKNDNGTIVSVDHGDAYPRAVVITAYNEDTGSSKNYTALKIPGDIGDNYTGVSVGGFEISDAFYLVAGNMIDFNHYEKDSDSTKNIFVASTSKSTGEASINQITNYQEDTTTTPQFVKLNNNRFLLLWGRESMIYYTEIDENGRQRGEIYSMKGSLSDCAPLIFNEKLIWYTWKDDHITFYEIDPKDLSKTNQITVDNGHKFELKAIKEHLTTLKCEKCGKEKMVNSPIRFSVSWRAEGSTGGYNSVCPNPFKVGESIEYCINPTWNGLVEAKELNRDFVLQCSDPEAIKITFIDQRKGVLSFQKIGKYTLTIHHRYDNSISEEVEFVVAELPDKISLNKTSLTLNPKKTYILQPIFTPENSAAVCTWTSSNEKVAAVDENGKVIAISKGKTKITVKTENGKRAVCTIKVKEEPESVRLSEEITLKKGETYSLGAVLTPSDAYTTYTWTSNNKKVATVNKKGKVTAIGKGTAKITVKTANGKTAVCKIVVQ